MNPSSVPPLPANPADKDLAEQAQPGHGVPSQDTDPAAKTALAPAEAEREAKSVMMGGGVVGGAALGAAIGGAVAGPVGVLVGGTLGAVAGALGGSAAGAMASADDVAGAGPGLAPARPVHLHIEDSGGSGRPVVLIHGWPLSSGAWSAQVPVLRAAGYRTAAYDRRGFGQSDKPESGYGYDTLVDNPDGPLTAEKAQQKKEAFEHDRSAYFEDFTRAFFSAHGVLQVSEAQRREALALCEQSAQYAALACMESFATTDFRADLKQLTVPTLVIHGDADAIVPFEGSGQRTHRAVGHSRLVKVAGAPHGLNVSHAPAFNDALLTFLQE